MQDIDNKSENSLDDFKDDENDDIIMMKNENNEYKINPNQIKQDSHLFKEEMPPDDLNDDNNNESDNDNNKNEIKDENNEEDEDDDDNDEEKYTNEQYMKDVMGEGNKINYENNNNNDIDLIFLIGPEFSLESPDLYY